MRRHEYESRYNPAVTELSRALIRDGGIHPDTLDKITRVLDGIEITDRIISEKEQVIVQKEQLLVQKERELESLRQLTDNSSNVVRNTINESKGNLDKATDLLNSGKFSEALKYSDIALYNIEGIDNLGLQTIAQANNLYLERNQQYVESVAKRDNFYKQGVINGVNAFSWVKDNPTRDFYTFFRETLKVSDKSPENVNLINNRLYHNLPKYLQEAQRANHFYNEYNKYHDALLKLQQAVNIHNIRAASSKGLKDYEEALRSCEIALEIDPQNLTLSNLKNAILQEKQNEEANKLKENNLLVSQTQEIEKLKEIISLKEVETEELLARKELELANKSLVKNQVINELQEDIGLKEKEALNLKIESLMKQLEFKDKALEDAREIAKQNKIINELKEKELADARIINELQGKLLAFQNLSKHDETLQLELSVIHFKVEESILNGNLDEMKELSKYLSELMKDPIEKEESLDISELLNNLSPIHNVQENQVQNPLAVINNFDINNVHTTHSVLISMSGEESAFSIIQEDGSH